MAVQHAPTYIFLPVGVDSPMALMNSSTTAADGSTNQTPNTITNHTLEYRVQSSLFCNDRGCYNVTHINALLERDIKTRSFEVAENIAETLFPDTAFGFAVNSVFMANFRGMFLTDGLHFNVTNFETETKMSVFLNRMISTIAAFFGATNIPFLKQFQPLRYFTGLHSQTPIQDEIMNRKPDVMLVHLMDGCLRKPPLRWCEVQALIEITRSKTLRMSMKETIVAKSFLTFCGQAERDRLIILVITSNGFHIVVADHAGMVETDVLPFNRVTNSSIFLRMVMGLAFLPDSYLGVDSSIICRDPGVKSEVEFVKHYTPFGTEFPQAISIAAFLNTPSWLATIPISIPDATTRSVTSQRITAITINGKVYPVIRVIYEAKAMIGRATKVFLVELANGTLGVVKDSFIIADKRQEVDFLRGLSIPFMSKLIDGCALANTAAIRNCVVRWPPVYVHEIREKRRIVTSPAGVPISDFANLWELMVVFLDIVIGM